jgi:hypothetical protein
MKQKITLSASLDRLSAPAVKKLSFTLIIGVCLLGCRKESKNVEEELINNAKSESGTCVCDPYIAKFNWKGRIVYEQYIKGPLCNGVVRYYDSNGGQFYLPAGMTWDIFRAQATFIEEIWSCTETPITHQ